MGKIKPLFPKDVANTFSLLAILSLGSTHPSACPLFTLALPTYRWQPPLPIVAHTTLQEIHPTSTRKEPLHEPRHNHPKIIPRILRGSCTLSQLYQCRLSVDCRTARAKCAVVAHYFDPPCCHIFNSQHQFPSSRQLHQYTSGRLGSPHMLIEREQGELLH